MEWQLVQRKVIVLFYVLLLNDESNIVINNLVGRPKLNRSSDLRPPKCSNKQTGLAGQPQLTMIDQRNNEELATIKTILPKEIQYIKNDQTVPHYEVFGTTSNSPKPTQPFMK